MSKQSKDDKQRLRDLLIDYNYKQPIGKDFVEYLIEHGVTFRTEEDEDEQSDSSR